ncbi:hypothetical protein AwDysgo_21870 [Bacteroidales bacterium]|nr:hypothetical protein AwDysgo_21870 [Bacteroidales bacterium]
MENQKKIMKEPSFIRKINLSICFCFISFIGIFAQNNLIPNTNDCSASRPPFAFDIQKKWTTATNNSIFTCTTPLAGDIDGDGKTEVFALTSNNEIVIFEGHNGAIAGRISPGVVLANAAWTGTTFCLLDGNEDGKGEVFIAAQSGSIFLYEVTSAPGVRPITFAQRWKKTGFDGRTSPVVSNLDGVGTPEFVVGNLIFDYDGNLKATLAFKGTAINFGYVCLPLVVDLDGDGLPEIVVGTNVYKYNGSTATLWKTCPNIPNQDGSNMAADINQDGNVDLVFHTQYNANPGFVKVWTPATGQDLGVVATGLTGQRSVPFVGDIDGIITNGKKYPEICINSDKSTGGSRGTLYAYSYTGSGFTKKWEMPHTDGSGGTILTLFDFNLDGVVELIYRDETHIHIFDGSGSVPVSKFSSVCGSETASELPIIADVTGDGSANIVVTGNAQGKSTHGEVMVFEGAASKWASAPNVWNQQLYSPLHVNLNLTIPKNVLSVNTTFTQTCQEKNGNRVQFYNGGPMQAPSVSSLTYCPIDLAPDPFVVDGSVQTQSNQVTISVKFGNQGKVPASGSIPIQFYKNEITKANIIGNTTLGSDLALGQTKTITQTYTISGEMPSKFFVRIMDDGNNFPALGAFSDCDLTNNTKAFGTLELSKVVQSLSGCVGGISIFTIKVKNNESVVRNDIELIDSLGTDWEFIAASSTPGTNIGNYSNTQNQLSWMLPSLAPGASAELVITARSKTHGTLRNTVWLNKIGNTFLGTDHRSAYVTVDIKPAPTAPSISPSGAVKFCPSSTVTLTANNSGGVSYQWYKSNIPLDNALTKTLDVGQEGSYTVTVSDGTCTSDMSSPVDVTNGQFATQAMITAHGANICDGEKAYLQASAPDVVNPVFTWYTNQTATSGTSGASFTTPVLSTTSSYYVSVSGDNYCENPINANK